MMRMSLKLRIALWFTILLMFISIIVFLIAAEVYWNYTEKLIQNELLDAVEEKVFLMQTDSDYCEKYYEGELSFSDFPKGDIYLMFFDETRNRISGVSVNEELGLQPYLDSFFPQPIMINGQKYYYYDAKIDSMDGSDLYIRGTVKAEKSIWDILKKHTYLLLAFPIMLLLAFIGGYWLTGRFLKPIKKIDETTEKIRASGDLSSRIEITGARDEITALAENINAMFEQLEINFESQKQFTSNVSHELRTPVSVILAQCEYAIENANDRLNLFQTISGIQKQGYKMTQLIESLLLFNRIERGIEEYKKEDVIVNELILSACEDFQLLSEKGITIKIQMEQEVIARINRELFELMLNNLLQNAIRYGKENGNVCVILRDEGNTFCLSVADDGQGIPEEDLPHIFDLFFRGDKSRNTSGLGLGLSLVKQVVKYHNGIISAESKEGQGTSFTIEFPKTPL